MSNKASIAQKMKRSTVVEDKDTYNVSSREGSLDPVPDKILRSSVATEADKKVANKEVAFKEDTKLVNSEDEPKSRIFRSNTLPPSSLNEEYIDIDDDDSDDDGNNDEDENENEEDEMDRNDRKESKSKSLESISDGALSKPDSETNLHDSETQGEPNSESGNRNRNLITGEIPASDSSDLLIDDFQAQMEANKIPKDVMGFENLRSVYLSLVDTFAKIQQEDVNLDPVKEEFALIWEGITASHNNELKLLEKDREMSNKLAISMGKTRAFIRLAQDDPAFAVKLGTKLERTWQLVDINVDEERSNVAKIEVLRAEIAELNRNVNIASRVEGLDALQELRVLKKDLEIQRNTAVAEANHYRSELHSLYSKRQEVFDHLSSFEEKSRLLDEEYASQLHAIERESSRKERINIETQEVRQKLVDHLEEMQEIQRNLRFVSNKIMETDQAVKDQRMVNEALLRDLEFADQRKDKLLSEHNAQKDHVNRLTLDAYKQAQDLKSKEVESQTLREDLMRASRQRTLNSRKVTALKQTMGLLEVEREILKGKMAVLEKELEQAAKMLEINKKAVETLDKERSFLNRNLKRAIVVTTDHTNQAVTQEIACVTLKRSVATYREEIRFQTHQIKRLEKERDHFSLQAIHLAQQVAQKVNEIRRYDMLVMNFRKKLGALEVQGQKVQQIYDIAVYDKGVYERNLHDTIAEIVSNNTRYRLLMSTISAIKSQLNDRDELIHQEALRYDRTLKETEFFAKQVRQIQRKVEDMGSTNDALENERDIIGRSTAELQAELSRQSFYAKTAQSRGELYTIKLAQMEQELQKTWEKYRTFYSMLRIGASHYRRIMKEIRDARLKILYSKKVLHALLKDSGKYVRLRREHFMLGHYISKEKCMITALADQLKLPSNVHRWRVLQATDPEAYELVERIGLLTKRLVTRTQILGEQSKQLSEKEAMYVEIHKCLQNAPSQELPEEVMYYRSLLEQKKLQLVTLKHELKTAETQTGFFRSEVKKLHNRMMTLKDQYFDKLKKEGTNSPGSNPMCVKWNANAVPKSVKHRVPPNTKIAVITAEERSLLKTDE